VGRESLSGRFKGKREILAQPGPKPLCSPEEEAGMLKHCLEMADLGYGYDVLQIRTLPHI